MHSTSKQQQILKLKKGMQEPKITKRGYIHAEYFNTNRAWSQKKIDTIYMLSNMLTHCTSDTVTHCTKNLKLTTYIAYNIHSTSIMHWYVFKKLPLRSGGLAPCQMILYFLSFYSRSFQFFNILLQNNNTLLCNL